MRSLLPWSFVAVGLVGCPGPDDDDTSDSEDTDVSDTGVDTDTSVDTGVDTGDTGFGPPEFLDGFIPSVGVPLGGNDVVEASRSWAVAIAPGAGAIWAVELAPRVGGDDALVVTLETDAGGEPSGTLVAANATATVPADQFSESAYDWVPAFFEPHVPVAAGTTYWVVARLAEGGTGSYTVESYDTGATGQLAMFEDGSWAPYDKTYDWPHRVFGYR
jgi:hypothetical protein